MPVEQIRESPQHQVAVLDHVATPDGGPRVVLQHQEAAVGVAHEVDAADVT